MVRTCEDSFFYEFELVGPHAVYGNPISQVTISHPVTKAYWDTLGGTTTYTPPQYQDSTSQNGFTQYFENLDQPIYHQTQFGFAPGENMTLNNLIVQTPTTCSLYPFLAPSPSPPPPDLDMAD